MGISKNPRATNSKQATFMNEKYYIYTEIVNCGKIGKIALDSFHKYHDHPVHIFGTETDFKWLIPHKNNILIKVDDAILTGYKKGHVGTALLWEKVICECPSQYLIHFDSDTIFRGNIIDKMIEKSKEYDLIGPIRNYHHNPHNRKDIMHLTDICQTNCTLFNREKISPTYLGLATKSVKTLKEKILELSIERILRTTKDLIKRYVLKQKRDMSLFARMIHGTYNPFSFKTIDFFDPIMFDMIQNGAKIFHLDPNEVGGCDLYGKRANMFKEINDFPTPYKLDFGSKLVHFSCVGSGMNFTLNPDTQKQVGKEYVACALDRYALFCKIFYNENSTIDLRVYKALIDIKPWY